VKKEREKSSERRRGENEVREEDWFLTELLLASHEAVICMEWELLINGSKVIAIERLFSKQQTCLRLNCVLKTALASRLVDTKRITICPTPSFHHRRSH